jgi:hypothetical protein
MINLHISVQAAASDEMRAKGKEIILLLETKWCTNKYRLGRAEGSCMGAEETGEHNNLSNQKGWLELYSFTYTFNMIDYINSLLVNCYQNGNVLLLE